MNNKIYIAILVLVFVIAGELLGITLLKTSRPDADDVLGSAAKTSVPEPVKKYCENYHLGGSNLLQTSEKPRSISRCGKHYRVEAPPTAVAAPYKMVNAQGEVVAICGGSSFDASIDTFEQKECEISCSLENICAGI